MIGIYKITNKVNGKIYIGQSKDIYFRWHRHHLAAFNNSYPQYNCLLYKAIRKYGIENFNFEVIEECEEYLLNEREQFYIEKYNSFDVNFGYNMITAIQYSENSPLSEESAELIRQFLLNSEMSQMEIAKDFNTSQMTVSSINLGYAWYNNNYTYPIRSKRKHHYCCDCGVEISSGAERCNACRGKFKAKTYVLPINREELKKLIRSTPFTKIGEMYSVSDNAVRKWCDKYNLPRKSKDIKKYNDLEWEQI